MQTVIMFSFNWLVIIWRWGGGGGVRLKLDVQFQGGRRIFDLDGQGGWGVLDNFHGSQTIMILVAHLQILFNTEWGFINDILLSFNILTEIPSLP